MKGKLFGVSPFFLAVDSFLYFLGIVYVVCVLQLTDGMHCVQGSRPSHIWKPGHLDRTDGWNHSVGPHSRVRGVDAVLLNQSFVGCRLAPRFVDWGRVWVRARWVVGNDFPGQGLLLDKCILRKRRIRGHLCFLRQVNRTAWDNNGVITTSLHL